MLKLATGEQSPDYCIYSDRFTGALQYPSDNPELADVVGEFSLFHRGENLIPVFFDYKNGPVFSAPE